MFGHFYNSSIRNYIVLLGELFGHVKVKRTVNNQDKYIKVPISYSSKEHFIEKLHNAFNNAGDDPRTIAQIDTILPRMSLQLVDLLYDEQFKTSYNNFRTIGSNSKFDTQYNPVPYKLTFQLGIYTRYQDDMFQIIEQILPYFQPVFNCEIKELHENKVIIDRVVPVGVTSVIMDEQLESDNKSRRRLEWTLTIELNGWLYPSASQIEGLIKTVYVDLFNNSQTLGEKESFESVDFQVDPDNVELENWNSEYVQGYGENISRPVDPEPSKPRGELSNGKINTRV